MRNILVIDDDKELCDLLQKYFSKEDFLLEHAGEGETGLALLARVRAVLRRLSVKQEQSDNADVSHEIRSPLQRMEIALALARGAEATELEDCLDRLETEVGRIDAMVEELLLLTRAESRMVPDGEIIHLEALISNVIEDIRFEEREARPEIDFAAAAADKLSVRGNPVLLERALRNILHNAVRYAPGSMITVRACENDGRAEISVADRGKGLPEDELEKIFLPWYRVNGTAQREGMGLGLNISRRIAESFGGSISASNNRDNGGLTVTIRLPLAGGSS